MRILIFCFLLKDFGIFLSKINIGFWQHTYKVAVSMKSITFIVKTEYMELAGLSSLRFFFFLESSNLRPWNARTIRSVNYPLNCF